MADDDERDFVAEMRRIIDAESGEGDYVPRLLADQIVAKLMMHDPELLMGWLLKHAEPLVWDAINRRDRSRRASARQKAGAARFAEAVLQHEGGDSTALGQFLELRYTVGDGTRRRLGDLGQGDLFFVADTYSDRARSNEMNATFLRVLARKVRDGKVSDYYDNEQLSRMWNSLTRG